MKQATTPPKRDPKIGHQSQYWLRKLNTAKIVSAFSSLPLSRLVVPSRPYPTIEVISRGPKSRAGLIA